MADLPNILVAEDVNRSFLGLPVRPWEVGGWLLGYWSTDARTVVVTSATPPVGRGSAFGVTIGGRGHRPKFDEAWEASDGRITFLGDWHTHPGGAPRPSGTDCGAMVQLATDPAYGTPIPVIAIVATSRVSCSERGAEIGYFVRASDDQIHHLEPRFLDSVPLSEQLPAWQWPQRKGRGFRVKKAG